MRNWTRVAMTESQTCNLHGCGLRMEVWFTERTYTAMVVQAVVSAMAMRCPVAEQSCGKYNICIRHIVFESCVKDKI